MPADPSIYNIQQTPHFNDPFKVLGEARAQQAQQAADIQQGQLREQQLQHGDRVAAAEQTAANEATDYKSIIGNPDLTPESFLEQVRLKVPGKYDAAVKRNQDIDAAAMELQSNKLKLADQTKQWVGGMLTDVVNSGYDPATTEVLLKKIETHVPDFAPEAAKIRAQILEGGPEALKKIVGGMLPRPAAKEGFTLKEGEQRFDATGKPIASVPVKPTPEPASLDAMLADALKRKDGPAQREILNAMAQKNAAGRAPAAPKDEGLVQIAGPDGAAIWVRKSDAEGKPAAQAARGVTGIERQSLAFYNRAAEAAKVVSPLEEKIAGMGLAGQTRLQVAPNWMQSDENQSYRQAQRAFTEARLRKESGAAINDKEYEKDAKTYFAVPGDSKATIAQKQQAREVLLNGMAYSAGKAYDEFFGEPRPGTPAKNQNTNAPAAPGPVATTGTTAAQTDAAKKAADLIKKYGGG